MAAYQMPPPPDAVGGGQNEKLLADDMQPGESIFKPTIF